MKPFLILVLGLSLAASSAAQDTATSAATASNDFGFKLYGELGGDASNVFVSPVSVGVALAMLTNGAKGETLAALTRALEMKGVDVSMLNARMKALRTAITTSRPRRGRPSVPFEVTLANSVWAAEGVAFVPDYITALDEHYGATARVMDFTDPATVEAINGWVKKATLGRIPDIIDRLYPDEIMILINTLTFTGQWTELFKPHLTRPMTFAAPGGHKTVPMMKRSGNMVYLRDDKAGLSAVSLNYQGGQARMILVLPDEGKDPRAFVGGLEAAKWRRLVGAMRFRHGTLRLPRMNVAYRGRLNDALKAMGLGCIFKQSDGFSGISPVNPFVSAVIHKTSLEVDEKGTKAAAATAIRLRKGKRPGGDEAFDLTFDRPFFCVIQHQRTGAVLFMGVINDPGTNATAAVGKSKGGRATKTTG